MLMNHLLPNDGGRRLGGLLPFSWGFDLVSTTASSRPRAFAPSWELRYSRKLIWTDAAVVTVAVTAGAFAASSVFWRDPVGTPFTTESYAAGTAAIALAYGLIWTIALGVHDSRRPAVFGTGAEEYNRVLAASLSTLGLLTLFLYLVDVPPQRTFLLVAGSVGIVLLLLGRWAWRKRLHQQRRRQRNSYRTLLIGERRKSADVARLLRSNTLAGFNIVGVVTTDPEEPDLLPGVPVVASYDGLLQTVERFETDTLIVTSADALTPRRLRRLGWELEPMGVRLIVATALTDVAGPRIHTRPVAGLPLIHVESPQFQGWRYLAKRTLDIFGSVVGIVLTSPLLILIPILIRVDSAGPVFFPQQRLGLRGRAFTMYKFRSMHVDAEQERFGLLDRSDGNGVLFKMHDDPRVTKFGKFIRRHSLDELPQLFNVLKGDMSLVGPRPPLPQEADGYEEWMHRRMFVRPGISGLWQVSGRSNLSWEESVRLDLYYVENWSMMGDLLILWRTIRAVAKGDGAY
ncbi:Undecaprenyl-phosphate galactose phosphotransferase WbaP/exopolysaccharide biosynthesis polyprenyl glycosylphosphotransferase [Mycolicibacterium mucogenicum 261Sha1.1M5]|nr:Undecaprenyl-phosphate galactose phosphotransferase WbaP/exopolysaccharide biosynthesis polyprenyl glycosylphosphotransferase [Mycolicibacterium mucogenicum 261Sha1.1M5]